MIAVPRRILRGTGDRSVDGNLDAPILAAHPQLETAAAFQRLQLDRPLSLDSAEQALRGGPGHLQGERAVAVSIHGLQAEAVPETPGGESVITLPRLIMA